MAADPTPYELPDERVKRAWERLLRDYLIVEELEPDLARRIRSEEARTFVEFGSATAPISRLLAPDGTRCVAIDLNPPDAAFRPTVCADLRRVPLPTSCFDAVAAVNCLYFLGAPSDGVAEAHRLLKPGGLFLAGAPSRFHDPELRDVLPDWGAPSPFDAEDAAAIVSTVFDEVEVEWWETPAYLLPDQEAVIDYLVAFKVPEPELRAATITTPTHVTKSGVNVWARR